MAKSQIHVWHTPEGHIVAIGRPAKEAKFKAVPVSGHGHSIFVAEVEERDIRSLHQTHAVDLENKKLIKRVSAARRK